MLEVQAPNHIRRKSRYPNALKTRLSKGTLGLVPGLIAVVKGSAGLRQRPRPLDQVDYIPVTIREEYHSISHAQIGLTQEVDAPCLQRGVRGVEIGDRDRQVADSGIANLLRRAGSFGWNDLHHGAVFGADEKIAFGFEINAKSQIVDVPLRQISRTGRSDRGMFEPLKHKCDSS